MRAKNKQSILIIENNAQIEIDFCDKILEMVAKKKFTEKMTWKRI